MQSFPGSAHVCGTGRNRSLRGRRWPRYAGVNRARVARRRPGLRAASRGRSRSLVGGVVAPVATPTTPRLRCACLAGRESTASALGLGVLWGAARAESKPNETQTSGRDGV